jgi:hypothetical protein
MACPKCASEDWKLASVIHAGGLSTISSTTIGFGGGTISDAFGGGIGAGAGIGSTSGEQQTELSKLAAPPEKPMRPAKAISILCWLTPVLCAIAFFTLKPSSYFVGITLLVTMFLGILVGGYR